MLITHIGSGTSSATSQSPHVSNVSNLTTNARATITHLNPNYAGESKPCKMCRAGLPLVGIIALFSAPRPERLMCQFTAPVETHPP